MECLDSCDYLKDKSAYQLITRLCEKLATNEQPSENNIKTNWGLTKKLRSKTYEILLKKSNITVDSEPRDAVSDLLSHYYVKNANKKSIADYNRVACLKTEIDRIIDDKYEEEPFFNEVLMFIVDLKETAKDDDERINFENPVSFGRLDELLQSHKNEDGNSPKPYKHYPSEIFQMPFTISDSVQQNNKYSIYPYDLDVFTAKPGTNTLNFSKLESSSSMTSLSHRSREIQSSTPLTDTSPYSCEGIPEFSRLDGPRQLNIPEELGKQRRMSNFELGSLKLDKMIQLNKESGPAATLWELASMDVDIQLDLWDEASKLPAADKRGFIASSLKQMYEWKQVHMNRNDTINVVSEKQFILHIKHLILGIESASFYLDRTLGKFAMRPQLCLEGMLQMTLKMYVSDLLKIGTSYWRLNNMVTNRLNRIEIMQPGVVYKVMCDIIERYLIWYSFEIDKIFGEGLITIEHDGKCLPTLLQVVNELKPLSVQIQTISRICNMMEIETNDVYLQGSSLMAYLYDEISIITEVSACNVMYMILEATCNMYFRFIQRFIFEGELEDYMDEFFIKKDPQNIESYNKRYWNKGFYIRNAKSVPEFLQSIAKHILLCGKSLRLLKLCNPNDPLCIMLSSDYPPMKCCMTFDDIKNQQMLYEQYRTQCLYVCGEPVTFQRLLIEKDAEQRTFREMVALKQAETMEKIISERKRLFQVLHTNKQQQFEVLRKAAENAIARRNSEREQNLKEERLLIENTLAKENVERLRLDEEKKKVKAFYEEIEEVINKRKMLADWKIKRLHLDVKRVELLTSEKINFDREHLEVEHKKLQDSLIVMNDSIELAETPEIQINVVESNFNDEQSDRDSNLIDASDVNENIIPERFSDLSMSDIVNSNVITEDKFETFRQQKLEAIRNKQKVLSHEFHMEDEDCNRNVVAPQSMSTINNNMSDAVKNRMKILGSNFDAIDTVKEINSDTPQYDTDACREALRNRRKVLGHEFGIDVDYRAKSSIKPRDNLTLNLNNCESRNVNDFTPEIGLIGTPSDLNVRLDIETPSTFNIGPFGLPSASCSSPTSNFSHSLNITEKITTKGFLFPNVGDVNEDNSDSSDVIDAIESDACSRIKSNVWNFSSAELNFDNFEPFGIKNMTGADFTKQDAFDTQFKLKDGRSTYTDIDEIIRDAEKKPLTDVFKMLRSFNVDEDVLNKIRDVDFNTMAVCLQRSVSIPLLYQMEMVNNAILKYFLVDCDLYDHLKNIRDYFFLMDGEFARTICNNLFDKLNTVESPKELLNFATLHNILDKAFGSSVSASKYAENLSFITNGMPISFHHNSPDALDCLTLSYNVEWPLNIIFSQEAMDRYAKVFQFLIKMRRISWTLERDSEVLKMSLKEEFMVSRDLLYSPQYHSIQLYRYTMSSLIKALHSYIATTCLQSSWSEFERDLAEAHTLDDLYNVHVIYVKKVLFRCLLNNRSASMMKLLNDIFSVCLRFHYFLNARCWHIAENEEHYTHPLFPQMRELFMLFEKHSRHLHKMITRLADCGYQPHLVELLTVINMNDYYKSAPTKK